MNEASTRAIESQAQHDVSTLVPKIECWDFRAPCLIDNNNTRFRDDDNARKNGKLHWGIKDVGF
jgi:hypothetical protein